MVNLIQENVGLRAYIIEIEREFLGLEFLMGLSLYEMKQLREVFTDQKILADHEVPTGWLLWNKN